MLLKELLKFGIGFPSRFRNAKAGESRHDDANDPKEIVSSVSSDVDNEVRKDFDDDEDCCAEVNFINILRAAFALIFLCQKITNPNCNWRKTSQNTFIKKSCIKC
jgi:hypothetical protein